MKSKSASNPEMVAKLSCMVSIDWEREKSKDKYLKYLHMINTMWNCLFHRRSTLILVLAIKGITNEIPDSYQRRHSKDAWAVHLPIKKNQFVNSHRHYHSIQGKRTVRHEIMTQQTKIRCRARILFSNIASTVITQRDQETRWPMAM